MAHRVDITKLLDGPSRLQYHIYIRSDGTSSDLSEEVIVDQADLNMGDTNQFKLEKVIFGLSGFSASIEMEYLTTNNLIWVLPEGSDELDFEPYGGLADRGDYPDSTGKILLNTNGLDGTDEGSFIIQIKRRKG